MPDSGAREMPTGPAGHNGESPAPGNSAQRTPVSTDDLETQCSFARSLDAPFPMIADDDRSISRAYDVLWPVIGMAQRVTYIISPERIIEAAFRHEIDIKAHRDDVLLFVNAKFRRTRGER